MLFLGTAFNPHFDVNSLPMLSLISSVLHAVLSSRSNYRLVLEMLRRKGIRMQNSFNLMLLMHMRLGKGKAGRMMQRKTGIK